MYSPALQPGLVSESVKFTPRFEVIMSPELVVNAVVTPVPIEIPVAILLPILRPVDIVPAVSTILIALVIVPPAVVFSICRASVRVPEEAL